jgi:hypothetical protein
MAGDLSYPFLYKILPWTFAILLSSINTILITKENRKVPKEFEIQRKFYFNLEIIFITFGLMRLFFLFSDFEKFTNGYTVLHIQFGSVGYLFQYIGASMLTFYVDKYFINSRNLIVSKLIIIFMLLSSFFILVSPFLTEIVDIAVIILYPGIYITNGIIILMILKIFISIKLKNLRKYVVSSVGIIFIFLGTFLDSRFFYDSIYTDYPIYVIIPAIFVIVGLIITPLYIKTWFELLLEFYTTKQICIIHRGNIEGKIHICPKCFVKYCSKCFKSVISIENKCWVCNYVFSKDGISKQEQLSSKLEISGQESGERKEDYSSPLYHKLKPRDKAKK